MEIAAYVAFWLAIPMAMLWFGLFGPLAVYGCWDGLTAVGRVVLITLTATIVALVTAMSLWGLASLMEV